MILGLAALGLAPAQAAPVVGGAPALPGRWPSLAAVHMNGSFHCSGVLIAPRLVLTAGHCNGELVDEVWVGGVEIDPDRGGQGQRAAVVARHEHPSSWTTLDATILELDADLMGSAPLALGCAGALIQQDAPAVLVGFGSQDRDGQGQIGLAVEADLQIVDPECATPDSGCNDGAWPAGELIAGGEGVDSCNGDSGGPLYILDGDRPYLAGVVARAAQPQTEACGDGGIYTRLDALVPWIQAETGATLSVPDCDAPNASPQPVDLELEAGSGATLEWVLFPGDPDHGQHHQLTVDAPDAWIEDGVFHFAGSAPTSLSVGFDDGEAQGEMQITITASGGRDPVQPAGCGSAAGGGLLWALLLLSPRSRRRASTAG